MKINGQIAYSQNISAPDDALTYEGHRYYIYSNVSSTWEAAESYCEALGGHLAVINDAAENITLYNYMKQMGYSVAFIGLTDAGHEGNWTWVTGDPVNYTNWYKGYPCDEPNNGWGGPVENYAQLWSGTNLTRNHVYTWNDAAFPKGQPFICEWDGAVKFTEDDDTAENTLNDIKLSALGGNDAINTTGDNVTIDGGADDDVIDNSGSEVSISGGGGNNKIKNGHFEGHIELVTIGTNGDKPEIRAKFIIDESLNGGNDVTIIAGNGNDEIQNFGGSCVTIDTGDGNNNISLGGTSNNLSIKGGKNNDMIIATGEKEYTVEGEPKTMGNGSQVTIEAVGGKNLVSIASTWSYVTVEGGNDSEGVDVIINDAEHVLLRGNDGNDYINSL